MHAGPSIKKLLRSLAQSVNTQFMKAALLLSKTDVTVKLWHAYIEITLLNINSNKSCKSYKTMQTKY